MPQVSRFVGIDVAMNQLDIHIAPDAHSLRVANTPAGLDRLQRHLAPGDVIALEASGGYERLAIETLAGAGWTVFRLHPGDVRAFARLTSQRAKTDALDARLIAHAARVAREAGRNPCQAHPEANDIKEMMTTRAMLQNQLAALKGQMTRLSTSTMRDILASQIAGMEQAIRQIERTVTGCIEANRDLGDKARRIQTVPGAGPVLAATLIASMPELGSLTSRQAASLVGVAPHPRQSGKASRPGRCQAGRAQVRKVLYMASLAAVRSKNSPLAAFYQRLHANGKPFKLAMVAVMRKLIVTLNAMIKSGNDWTPNPI